MEHFIQKEFDQRNLFFSVEEGTSICEKTKTMLKQKKDEGTLVGRKKFYAFGSWHYSCVCQLNLVP